MAESTGRQRPTPRGSRYGGGAASGLAAPPHPGRCHRPRSRLPTGRPRLTLPRGGGYGGGAASGFTTAVAPPPPNSHGVLECRCQRGSIRTKAAHHTTTVATPAQHRPQTAQPTTNSQGALAAPPHPRRCHRPRLRLGGRLGGLWAGAPLRARTQAQARTRKRRRCEEKEELVCYLVTHAQAMAHTSSMRTVRGACTEARSSMLITFFSGDANFAFPCIIIGGHLATQQSSCGCSIVVGEAAVHTISLKPRA